MAGDKKTEMSFDPPNELRCSRHDGKSWRCNHWRIHNQKYCEEHYLKLKGKSSKKEIRSRLKKESLTGIEFQTRQRRKRRKPEKGLKSDTLGRRTNTLKAGKVNGDQGGGEVDEVLPQKKDTRNSNVCGRSGGGGGDGDSINGVGGGWAANEEFLINFKNGKGLKRKIEEFESKDEDAIGKNCKKVKKSVKIGKEEYKSVGEDREHVKEVLVYKRRKVNEKHKGETAGSNLEDKKGIKTDHLLFDRKARFLERFRRILQLDEDQDEENIDGPAKSISRTR